MCNHEYTDMATYELFRLIQYQLIFLFLIYAIIIVAISCDNAESESFGFNAWTHGATLRPIFSQWLNCIVCPPMKLLRAFKLASFKSEHNFVTGDDRRFCRNMSCKLKNVVLFLKILRMQE